MQTSQGFLRSPVHQPRKGLPLSLACWPCTFGNLRDPKYLWWHTAGDSGGQWRPEWPTGRSVSTCSQSWCLQGSRPSGRTVLSAHNSGHLVCLVAFARSPQGCQKYLGLQSCGRQDFISTHRY